MNKSKIVFIQIKESIIAAIDALRLNKVRALLSTLGITIGIFCIIAVLSVVESFQISLEKSVESLGKDVVFVEKWPWSFSSDYKWWKYMNRPNTTLNELKNINEKTTLSDAQMLTINLSDRTIKSNENSASGIDVIGVTHDYYLVRSFDINKGRYFTENETGNAVNVCLIGNTLSETFFPNVYPIEREIKISGRGFKIVGVFKKEGESMIGNSLDNVVIIPLQTAAKYVRVNSDYAESRIHVKARDGVAIETLQEEINGIMRSQRKLRPGEVEDFALNKTTLISEPIKDTFKTVNIAGWIIGVFAMLVGGFGIANIMFVSVKERTNQIGIQKSLGAKNYFILIEFLVEAIILCIIGCVFGLVLVWLLIWILSSSFEFQFFLSAKNIFTGIVVSVVIGVVAGIIPAWQASTLNPVDAIRSK